MYIFGEFKLLLFENKCSSLRSQCCKNETFWRIFTHCDVSGFSASLNSNWETRLRGIYFCCYFRTRSNNISFLGRAAAVEERLLCVLEKVGSCQKVAKESSSVWCNQIHIKEMHFSHKDNMMKVLLKKVYKSKLYYSQDWTSSFNQDELFLTCKNMSTKYVKWPPWPQ